MVNYAYAYAPSALYAGRGPAALWLLGQALSAAILGALFVVIATLTADAEVGPQFFTDSSVRLYGVVLGAAIVAREVTRKMLSEARFRTPGALGDRGGYERVRPAVLLVRAALTLTLSGTGVLIATQYVHADYGITSAVAQCALGTLIIDTLISLIARRRTPAALWDCLALAAPPLAVAATATIVLSDANGIAGDLVYSVLMTYATCRLIYATLRSVTASTTMKPIFAQRGVRKVG